MHREHFGDPRHRSENKGQRMNMPAKIRGPRPGPEHHHHENPDADPRIRREVQPGEREREARAGDGGRDQSKPCGITLAGIRGEPEPPRALRHQCLRIALKPEASRPFFAAWTAFWSL